MFVPVVIFVVIFAGEESVFVRIVIMRLMLTIIFLIFPSVLFITTVVYHVTDQKNVLLGWNKKSQESPWH